MRDERTVYDVVGTFYGLTGRQRKIQFNSVSVENLEEKPTAEQAEKLIRAELATSNARNVTRNDVGITIRECKVGGGFKSYDLFGFDDTKFYIEFDK